MVEKNSKRLKTRAPAPPAHTRATHFSQVLCARAPAPAHARGRGPARVPTLVFSEKQLDMIINFEVLNAIRTIVKFMTIPAWRSNMNVKTNKQPIYIAFRTVLSTGMNKFVSSFHLYLPIFMSWNTRNSSQTMILLREMTTDI